MTTLSIVTAVRNGAETLRHCLDTVAGQTIPVDHVVVDGGSTDETLELLRRAEAAPSARKGRFRFVTGRDKGIYDGMNKGIALASGDVIGTLNADDFYPNPQVLEKVSAVFDDPAVDACYGDLVFVRELASPVDYFAPLPHKAAGGVGNFPDPAAFRIVRSWRAGVGSLRRFYWGWMPPHPTFFVRRQVYARCGFYRLDMGTAADYELMLRFVVKHGMSIRYIPEVIVYMRVGGVSTRGPGNRLAAHRMDRLAWRVNGLQPYPWTVAFKPLRKVGQLRPFQNRSWVSAGAKAEHGSQK